MTQVLDTLLPVFLLIALGVALKGVRFLPGEFFRQVNRLVFWVGLPAFLFHRMTSAPAIGAEALGLFRALLVVTALTAATAMGLGAALRWPLATRGVFTQASYRANLAYVGWPIVAFAFPAAAPAELDAIVARAVLAAAPLIPLYNVLAILLLLPEDRGVERSRRAREALRTLGSNPLVIACLLALAVRAAHLTLPLALRRSIQALGDISLPLALMSLGATFTVSRLAARWPSALGASLLRVAAGPALAWLAARWLALGATETRVAMLYMACPTAVATYIVSDQMGGDSELAAGAILVSTILSFVALAAVLLVAP